MDGPRDCHTEERRDCLSLKSDRERETSYDIAYMRNRKRNDANELTKQKQTHRLRERTYGYQQGKVGGRDRECGIDMYTLLYLKWITNKDLL